MFDKNDGYLFAARVAAGLLTAALAVLAAMLAILFFAEGEILLAVFALLGGGALCFIFWLACRLVISFLIDVKLIRNKLYGADSRLLEQLYPRRKGEKELEKGKSGEEENKKT